MKTRKERNTTEQTMELSHDEIASRAYSLYLEEGQPEGRDLAHWLNAEAMLRGEHRGQGQTWSPLTREDERTKANLGAGIDLEAERRSGTRGEWAQ